MRLFYAANTPTARPMSEVELRSMQRFLQKRLEKRLAKTKTYPNGRPKPCIVHFENRNTAYTSSSLRAFFEAGCAYHGVHNVKLVCVPSPGRTRGCATIEPGVNEVVIQIASPSRLSLKKLARLFEHELLHTRGMVHEQMSEEDYWSQGPEPFWARGRSLTLKKRTHR